MSDEPATNAHGFPLYGADRRTSKYQRDTGRIDSLWNLCAVDPGGEHVGVSMFAQAQDRSWQCIWAGEFSPIEFEDWLSEAMIKAEIDELVVETWRLFPDKAMLQTGSDMPTSQLIGAMRYIWRMTCNIGTRWPAPDVEWYWQDPTIKVPTRSMLRNRGIKSMSKFLKIPNDHASDSELHGYHHILQTRKEEVRLTLIPGWEKKHA